MDMPNYKAQMLRRAEKSIEDHGSAEIVAHGQRFEVTDLLFNARSCKVAAQLPGGRTLILDAADPFAVIVKG